MRSPNRMWITQPGDRFVHREARVIPRAEVPQVGTHGETYCGITLRPDRRRTSDIPAGDVDLHVCPKCRRGRIAEYRGYL